MPFHITNSPLLIDIPKSMDSIYARVRALLGHYDLRVYIGELAFIDIGRGSVSAMARVVQIGPEAKGCLGTVGQFCEFAEPCELLGGGEHRNQLPVNTTLSGVPMYHSIAIHNNLLDLTPAPHKPFHIGNAVVVSTNALIMPGAVIGNGALIGANAVVKGEIEPFSVCAGVPARKFRDRVNSTDKQRLSRVRWWDFDMAYLGQNLDVLQRLAVDTSNAHVYREESPRFIIRYHGLNNIKVLGYLDNNNERLISEAPRQVQQYVAQIERPGPYNWVANIWHE